MGIESGFLHRCRIERATITQDAYHQKHEDWSERFTNVPCRLVEKTRTIVSTETAGAITVTTSKLLMPAGVDVRIGDRIGEITLETGEVLPKSFRITNLVAVRGRAVHHRSAVLEEVS
jgi:hypothetical protein